MLNIQNMSLMYESEYIHTNMPLKGYRLEYTHQNEQHMYTCTIYNNFNCYAHTSHAGTIDIQESHGHTFTHLHTIYAHAYTVSAFINTNTSINRTRIHSQDTHPYSGHYTNIHASLTRHWKQPMTDQTETENKITSFAAAIHKTIHMIIHMLIYIHMHKNTI